MANAILKDNNGKIWVNESGKILKAKSFSESVIQNGLSFWGAADPNYLTIVDGLVSEAYDIRGTGQFMVQSTVAKRPILTSIVSKPALYFAPFNFPNQQSLQKLNQTYNSLFIVGYSLTNINQTVGLGYISPATAPASAGLFQGFYTKTINGALFPYYQNNVKKLISSTIQYFYIACSLEDSNSINVNMFLQTTMGGQGYILEWGWYNRLLTEIEVIYNINALNAKYAIF